MMSKKIIEQESWQQADSFFLYACKQNSLSYSEALASNWLAQVKPWQKTVFDLPPASCN